MKERSDSADLGSPRLSPTMFKEKVGIVELMEDSGAFLNKILISIFNLKILPQLMEES
jgi:hypothetical protein